MWRDTGLLVARELLGLIFLWAGARKLFNWKGTEVYVRTKMKWLIPILLPLAIAMQIVGSLSIMLGVCSRMGALLLIAFTLPATTQMHAFWNLKGNQRVAEKIHFFKDLAIVGGLLLLIIAGPGRFTLFS
jgi:putative oxidoreductase